MASIAFIVNGLEWDQHQHSKHGMARHNKLMSSTITKYKDHTIKFIAWHKETYGAAKPSKCKKHIQAYADFLSSSGKSASTVHDYINGICRVLGVPLASINTPRRVTAQNKNNRRANGPKAVDRRRDSKAEASPRLSAFASVVGIRRAEYGNLHGNDYATDESGYPCVVVRRGKNGKRQLQRIPTGAIEFAANFFDGSENYVFTKDELKNTINLHRCRGELARRMYGEYLNRIENEPGYANQLRNELYARFKTCGVEKKWKEHEVQGVYRLRGDNRKKAELLGLPTEYCRLAVMAVSVFHLSHWRTNVTVANYLLAI